MYKTMDETTKQKETTMNKTIIREVKRVMKRNPMATPKEIAREINRHHGDVIKARNAIRAGY